MKSRWYCTHLGIRRVRLCVGLRACRKPIYESVLGSFCPGGHGCIKLSHLRACQNSECLFRLHLMLIIPFKLLFHLLIRKSFFSLNPVFLAQVHGIKTNPLSAKISPTGKRADRDHLPCWEREAQSCGHECGFESSWSCTSTPHWVLTRLRRARMVPKLYIGPLITSMVFKWLRQNEYGFPMRHPIRKVEIRLQVVDQTPYPDCQAIEERKYVGYCSSGNANLGWTFVIFFDDLICVVRQVCEN